MDISIDSEGKMNMSGDYQNNSKFIRVECSDEGSFPIVAAPFGHAAYVNPIYVMSVYVSLRLTTLVHVSLLYYYFMLVILTL